MNIEERLEAVKKEYVRRMTSSTDSLLHEVESYASASFGKLLRPRLTLLSAASMGEEAYMSERTILLATAVEMLHNTSLLHDDVIDNAAIRRHRQSINERWNSKIAILVGDYQLVQLMRLLHDVDDDGATERVCQTVESMCRSEILQQDVINGREMTKEVYLRIVQGKTAELFATACAFGNPQYEEVGRTLGVIFQLKDDIADNEQTKWTGELIEEYEGRLTRLRGEIEGSEYIEGIMECVIGSKG